MVEVHGDRSNQTKATLGVQDGADLNSEWSRNNKYAGSTVSGGDVGWLAVRHSLTIGSTEDCAVMRRTFVYDR